MLIDPKIWQEVYKVYKPDRCKVYFGSKDYKVSHVRAAETQTAKVPAAEEQQAQMMEILQWFHQELQKKGRTAWAIGQ